MVKLKFVKSLVQGSHLDNFTIERPIVDPLRKGQSTIELSQRTLHASLTFITFKGVYTENKQLNKQLNLY